MMTVPLRRQFAALDYRLLVTLIIVSGVALTLMSFIYLVEPAESLPDFFPGRDDGSSRHLTVYGVAGGLLGFGAFGLAAFVPDADRRGPST
jgi:hypothetical protein